LPTKLRLSDPTSARAPSDLRPACDRCFGLCCVALPFAASAQFALDKQAAEPCPNLTADFRCAIHTCLRQQGFAGCTAFDCFGAGQKVSQQTFAGRDWRAEPALAAQMFAVFPIVQQLHEMLWYLREVSAREPARALYPPLRALVDETERWTRADPARLLAFDVPAHRQKVGALLFEASERIRAAGPKRRKDRRGADMMGKDLRLVDLRAANLRGAYLIATDLRGVDLRLTDLLGADLRDADLRDADLTDSLFVTQAQVGAAKGNAATKLPQALSRPTHWLADDG
jgi:hypothetical protein